MAFGGITNFNGAALDQQLFAVDRRIAQSTLLNGNLFGSLGSAQQSSLDAVFGGLGSLNFGIPGTIGFPAPGPIGFQAPASIGFPAPAGIGFPDPGRIGFSAPSPLSLQIPQTIGFAQSMLGSLGALSNGWAGLLGGSGFGAFGGAPQGGRSCH
ncbi:MAG: hypothetical protein KF760_35495 [Candidatus Eremiobacteraeota bacterium]|nr:hypothetical protein [Candidatus Eremiobacteraeota bacterium]MCW5872922.1 hypothetical protein [Candidatus Eremiobacteraeota bacterium]